MEFLVSEQPPTRTTGKVSHAIAKAALGSIPLAGAAASELFAFVITSPLERRRDEWMHAVAERLGALEDRRAESLTYLQYDESFLDTVLQASQIALRTHHKEKRHALLNAITNAAMPHAPDESERQMFLGMIDAFTVWHL
ncbi:MAG: hypothetical protein IID31_09430 [Planctomycetes bacterium]|nr:hypothetical protein [Planctomycetota bacterium]